MLTSINSFNTLNSLKFKSEQKGGQNPSLSKSTLSNLPQVNPVENKELSKKVAIGTALSVGAMLAIIAKKQGFKLNPAKIFTQNPKDWAIFKIPNKTKTNGKILELEEFEIVSIGAASVLGGLVTGAKFDPKNKKEKVKEALNQILGDIAVPLSFVAVPARIYKSNEKAILSHVPQIKNTKNNPILKYTNKFFKALPASAITAGFLSLGIVAGNRVSNLINEKVYHEKVERKIKPTDFAPHLDDLCLAISLMASNSPVGSIISKFIPVALMVAGNETGKAQKNPHVQHSCDVSA